MKFLLGIVAGAVGLWWYRSRQGGNGDGEGLSSVWEGSRETAASFASSAGQAARSAAGQVASAVESARASLPGLGATCPVCGASVAKSADSITAEYGDETYYFNSKECSDRFNQEPDIFTLSGGEPEPEGQLASNDRGLHPRTDANVPGKDSRAPATLEQPRVESGSG